MLLDEMNDTFTPDEQTGIKKAIAYLNRNQFFHAETPGNTAIRRALTTAKSRRFIDQSFSLLGYHFIYDEVQGWFGILPGEDIAQSRTMTMVDTLILLVAARAYNVGFADGWVDGRGNVETSFNDFCDTVQSFAVPAEMNIQPAQIRNSLRDLEFMSLVDLGQKVEASGDIPMKIRPFIGRILTTDVTVRLENFINRKNTEVVAEGASPAADENKDADDLGLPLEN
ncbi:hypothetical protein GOB57_09310 [Sinorhizobium meliloti]|nr:hypothetical protein [Sinorhizobium meliloti]